MKRYFVYIMASQRNGMLYIGVNLAITREKQLKKWKRSWKLRLIETLNPEWQDLYAGLDPCLRRDDMNPIGNLRTKEP